MSNEEVKLYRLIIIIIIIGKIFKKFVHKTISDTEKRKLTILK